MEAQNKNHIAFWEFLKTGLWADVEYTDLGTQRFSDSADWEIVYQLAEEQSVIGLVLAERIRGRFLDPLDWRPWFWRIKALLGAMPGSVYQCGNSRAEYDFPGCGHGS